MAVTFIKMVLRHAKDRGNLDVKTGGVHALGEDRAGSTGLTLTDFQHLQAKRDTTEMEAGRTILVASRLRSALAWCYPQDMLRCRESRRAAASTYAVPALLRGPLSALPARPPEQVRLFNGTGDLGTAPTLSLNVVPTRIAKVGATAETAVPFNAHTLAGQLGAAVGLACSAAASNTRI